MLQHHHDPRASHCARCTIPVHIPAHCHATFGGWLVGWPVGVLPLPPRKMKLKTLAPVSRATESEGMSTKCDQKRETMGRGGHLSRLHGLATRFALNYCCAH